MHNFISGKISIFIEKKNLKTLAWIVEQRCIFSLIWGTNSVTIFDMPNVMQMRLPCRVTTLHTTSSRRTATAPAGMFVPDCGSIDKRCLQLLQDFVSQATRLFVISGAGLSTESGIPDYRSEGVGLYARTDRRPMQHVEFVRSAKSRQRYWARNFLGWPQFSSHHPNAAHRVLQRWEERGKLHWLGVLKVIVFPVGGDRILNSKIIKKKNMQIRTPAIL